MRRVSTHLRDEDINLCQQEALIFTTHPHLAHQIAVYRMIRGRFHAHHVRQLLEIQKLPAFTGTILPGISLEAPMPAAIINSPADIQAEGSEPPEASQEIRDLEEEEEDEEADVEAERDMLDILTVTLDAVSLTN